MNTKPFFSALPLLPIAFISMLGFVSNVQANVAYVGLADEAYPVGDNDFQDLNFFASGADLFVASGPTATFQPEPGQSMPSGVLGVVDGKVSTGVAGDVTFTYGGALPAPPATGHGNSTDYNLVYFGSDRNYAEQHNLYFFHGDFLSPGQTWTDSLGNVLTVSTANVTTVTLAEQAGALDFHFVADITGHNVTIDNGGPFVTNDPAYIAAVVPEPGSLALLGAGLLGLGALRRRGPASDSKGILA